jgi:hypothetical protein
LLRGGPNRHCLLANHSTLDLAKEVKHLLVMSAHNQTEERAFAIRVRYRNPHE